MENEALYLQQNPPPVFYHEVTSFSLRNEYFSWYSHTLKQRRKEDFQLKTNRFKIIGIVAIVSFIVISGCTDGNTSDKEGDYDTTKKMVVDILQTEEGKKAIRELMTDEKLKQELVLDSDVVKKSINEALVSEKGKQMWTILFQDTDFVKEYTKSMQEEHMKLMKRLMNDADYQKQMLELLQNPEMTDQMLQVVKSQQFREHLGETIQQTLETPLFQEKMQETLLKAAEKQGKQLKEESKDEEGEGGSDGGTAESDGGG